MNSKKLESHEILFKEKEVDLCESIKTKVISTFPACGKSYCFNNRQEAFSNGILDSDSSDFSWIKDEAGKNTRTRNPEFPENYINHINENIGKVDIIFVSSHDIVRTALKANNIKYTLIYPDFSMKDEWMERLEKRGNNSYFIKFIELNWEIFIGEMEKEIFPAKIKLPWNGKKFLDLDILSEIR